MRFEPLNMVLYINGLTNNIQKPAKPEQPGWWDRPKGMFR
jgi:protein SCO1